jgi:hypothetical protein
MSSINKGLQLFQEVYNTEKHSSVNYLSDAKLADSDLLQSAVVKLYGGWSKRFPLYLSTKGKGRVREIGSADTTFKLPVIGKPKKTSAISKTIYNASSVIGGRNNIILYFSDRWFRKGEIIETNKRNKIQIQFDGEAEGDSFKYVGKIVGSNPNKLITLAEVSAGARFASMYTAVGLKNSRGTEARSQSHGFMWNQCTFLRFSYNYEGNISNKVVNIQLPTEGGTTNYWEKWETYQHELKFMEECENALWYGEFNRTGVNGAGAILDKDVNTGEIVVMGSGLLEQIPNKSTYGILTKEKIKSVMRNVFYNASPDMVKKIKLWTGVGGREAFHEAFQADMKAMGFQFAASEKNIGGEGANLTYGAYFGTFRHIDGHEVSLEQLPLLDYGSRADAAPKHPIYGLPITSYDMYFVDESTIEGEHNLAFVQEKGRSASKKYVSGFNSEQTYISTDADVSSVQFAKSVGIHLLNPTTSFVLTCNLS